MISEISIQNFKSVEKLTLPLGRVNVLIGENGAGKSNILEAIAFFGAVTANKTDDVFLVSRGVRVANSKLMFAAFQNPAPNTEDFIPALTLAAGSTEGLTVKYSLRAIPANPDKEDYEWINVVKPPDDEAKKLILERATELDKIYMSKADDELNESPDLKNAPEDFKQILRDLIKDSFADAIYGKTVAAENRGRDERFGLSRFLIYTPENTTLRRFDEEGQIQPVGIRGEGLFKMLQTFGREDYADRLAELKESLELIGWFLDFRVPPNLAPGESRLQIYDRFLGDNVPLDQRSANEGFLFLLFYFAVFLSKSTPAFFAIDNVDASLNPRLCEALMSRLVELAKKYDKQVILTTHNPAILDGLDLKDDEQRLFSISRTHEGRTQARRIAPPKPQPGEYPVRLSEAFLRGLLGGVPKNF